MEKIKLPAFISAGIFVLFFIINLAVGNTFGVIFLRSLISAAVVFALAFGFIFLLENYFDINFKDIGREAKTETPADKESVDIMLDDEEIAEKPGDEDTAGESNDTQFEYNENSEDFTGDIEVESAGGDEPDVSSNSSTGETDEYEQENNPDKSGEIGDLNLDNYSANIGGSGDDYGFAGAESSEDAGSNDTNQSMDYSNIKPDDGRMLKDKIGFDISYDDVAKAIRTKLKEE